MKKFAIIVAAGSGSRMAGNVPKQFMMLGGKPVLLHTLLKFYNADPFISIIVVLPEIHINYWKALCDEHKNTIVHKIIAGGQSRFESVGNGIRAISENGWVAVHDGVRPLISSDGINNLFREASIHGNAIPALPVKDSLREISADSNKSIDRSRFRIIQTPQIFEVHKIKQGFSQPFQKLFTDEATVMESIGETIFLAQGEEENIKITTPGDLRYAESIIGQ